MHPLASGQYPGAQRRRIGDAVVTALADGYFDLGRQTMPTASDADLAPLADTPYATPDTYRSSINAYLVEMGAKRILIDTGGAQSGAASLGRLGPTLDAMGIEPGTVDALVMTHLHPDHAGGAFDESGGAAFENAEMILHTKEHAYWHDDALITEDNRHYFDIARKATDAYMRAGRLTMFDTDREVIPGVFAEFLPGHTPGHTGYRIESAGDALLIWGDIVHIPPVQMKDPGIGVAFDVDGALAEKTRRHLLDRAISDKLKIAGMHLPWPGIGYVERDGQREGDGYRFALAPYDYDTGHP